MQRAMRKRKVDDNNGFGNKNRKQPVDQARRKALKAIVAGTAAAGVLAVSSKWSKPVVNSVILPAHAQATNVEGPTAVTTLPVQENTNACTCFEIHYPAWDDSFITQAPVTAQTAEFAPLSRRVSVQKNKE